MKTKEISLLLSVNTLDEYFEGAGAALFTLTPKLKENILKANVAFLELKRQIERVYEVSIFNDSIDLLGRNQVEKIDENILNDFDCGAISFINLTGRKLTKFKKVVEYQNIESVIMQINDNGVSWNGYYRHTNVRFETGSINIDKLQKMKF